MNIINYPLNAGQYNSVETIKKQIYLHHTAGNESGFGVVNWWNTNADRIATSYVITGKVTPTKEKDGDVIQCFDDKFWAYHLGLQQSVFTTNNIPYAPLDKTSIGIEVCNWGQLTKKGSKYYNYVNKEVADVIELPKAYKGYKYWHNYTDAQLNAIKELLLQLGKKHNISLKYNEDIWAISKRALMGVSGVFTHNSVRTDKVDVYPHPKLIEILQSF